MRKTKNRTVWVKIGGIALGTLLLLALLYQIPAVKQRVSWRLERARVYAMGAINPAGELPTPLHTPFPTLPPATPTPTQTPAPTQSTPPTPTQTLLPTATPTPIPASYVIPAPPWDAVKDKQGPNNCGPASLAIYLRHYGWSGDQYLISDLIKPVDADRNVNPEELVYYVRTRAGWLNAEFRVGGDLELLKRLLAAGFPVLIEESFYFEEPFWPNDDLWAAHYFLVTGYDDASQHFVGQDSYYGQNQLVSYEKLDKEWKIFNRVYLIVYLPDQEQKLKDLLGVHWDVDANRQHALQVAQAEVDADPEDAYAWFNLGSNLVYFGDYVKAANAYDQARELGLPQRMLRYQFGPFFAYFHSGQVDELLTLTDYALRITDKSEEALLWQGWGHYRKGDSEAALQDWRKALEVNPNYQDALYAINFASSNP